MKAKVLFVLWSGADFGGLERRYLRVATGLAGVDGIDVKFLCQGRAAQSVLDVLQSSAPLIVTPRYPAWVSSLPSRIFRVVELITILLLVRRAAVCNIIFCGNPGFISGVLAKFKQRTKHLVVANALLAVDLPLRTLDRLGILLLARSANVTLDHLSNEPRAVFSGLTCETARVFRHRIAPCSFTNYSLVEQSIFRDIDVLMIARFVDGKGYDLLECIDSEMQPYNAHYCGFGPRKISVRNAKVYKTSNSFGLLSRSKIFLSLQKTNNYPSQSLLEAMASGCAIIATDVGETRRLLDDTRAILVHYNSSEVLGAIRRLIGDDELRKRLGAEARDHVLANHTTDRYVKYFATDVLKT